MILRVIGKSTNDMNETYKNNIKEVSG